MLWHFEKICDKVILSQILSQNFTDHFKWSVKFWFTAQEKKEDKFARVFPQSTVAFAQLCFILAEMS